MELAALLDLLCAVCGCSFTHVFVVLLRLQLLTRDTVLNDHLWFSVLRFGTLLCTLLLFASGCQAHVCVPVDGSCVFLTP